MGWLNFRQTLLDAGSFAAAPADRGGKTAFLILEKNRSLIDRPPLEGMEDPNEADGPPSALDETKCSLATGARDIDSLVRKNRLTDTITISHAPRGNDDVWRAMYGTEAWVFYPGKKGGKMFDTTCDDTSKEFCWQKARVLNDLQTDDKSTSCDLKDRCLHVLWRDGGDQYPYTCPSWIRHPFSWVPCNSDFKYAESGEALPVGKWQPCPQVFTLTKPDEPGGEVDLARWYEASRKKEMCVFNDDTHCLWEPGKRLRDAKEEKEVAVDESDDDPTILKKEPPKTAAEAGKGGDDGDFLPTEEKFVPGGETGVLRVPAKGDGDAGGDADAGGGKAKAEAKDPPRGMYFNLVKNEWVQCVEKMRCRLFPLKDIMPVPHKKDAAAQKVPIPCKCTPSSPQEKLQCLIPDESTGFKPVCADKSALRVVIPYDRTALRESNAARPIKNGLLLNDAFL
mmetsp:Transcript_8706/g.21099  ORF Transcript_8706/g.21099 Transcript_8706/m.21099 type:complete len:452 (+) Transcript_8706:133-1488(+)|eukprot:CAMPEP_0178995384 /NCGR_PEP_ID=MMETSP0795-20121207/7801_1 /TAXON_ID=88552 /ORGANISM="Amoebophrya sp., Strain Ameob2" /LENGTH=451 /DNA_ID=CAMNT_0020687693 /DNA_START=93 /DNA_END=1448 /DNA_ORIENTATION=+